MVHEVDGKDYSSAFDLEPMILSCFGSIYKYLDHSSTIRERKDMAGLWSNTVSTLSCATISSICSIHRSVRRGDSASVISLGISLTSSERRVAKHDHQSGTRWQPNSPRPPQSDRGVRNKITVAEPRKTCTWRKRWGNGQPSSSGCFALLLKKNLRSHCFGQLQPPFSNCRDSPNWLCQTEWLRLLLQDQLKLRDFEPPRCWPWQTQC